MVPPSFLPYRSTTRTSPGSSMSMTYWLLRPGRPFSLRFGVDYRVQVGPRGHESRGDHPAGHCFSRVKDLPSVGVLAIGGMPPPPAPRPPPGPPARQRPGPAPAASPSAAAGRGAGRAAAGSRGRRSGKANIDLFGGQPLGPLNQGIGHLWPAVGKPVASPGLGVFQHLFLVAGPRRAWQAWAQAGARNAAEADAI